MLITFSKPPADTRRKVVNAAQKTGARAEVKWATELEVRFTLPGASDHAHDEVIRLLLEIDPMAKIRTARAVYEGLADYQAQLAARVP